MAHLHPCISSFPVPQLFWPHPPVPSSRLVRSLLRYLIFPNLPQRNKGTEIPFWMKTLSGMSSGAIAVTIGTPMDVALVRMQSDSMKPKGERRNYKHVIDALRRCAAEEGIGSLYAVRMLCASSALRTRVVIIFIFCVDGVCFVVLSFSFAILGSSRGRPACVYLSVSAMFLLSLLLGLRPHLSCVRLHVVVEIACGEVLTCVDTPASPDEYG